MRLLLRDDPEVFLCHARLYKFVDNYDVGPLRDLSLHKLQRSLAEFTLYDQRVGEIVHLMRYSYSNTTDHIGSADGLRILVAHYVVFGMYVRRVVTGCPLPIPFGGSWFPCKRSC